MARRYSQRPKLDTGALPSHRGAPTIGLTTSSTADAHTDAQERHRIHDQAIESMRTTRATKDRDRIYPRAGTGDVSPRRGRHALLKEEPRLPISAHQAAAQQRQKRAALKTMPRTESTALRTLVTEQRHWDRLNAVLDEVGRGQRQLSVDDARTVGRLDRAIRRGERHNDRTHRVYTGLQLDPEVVDNLHAWIKPGTEYTFDGYIASDHSPHKISTDAVMLEITGKRGLYLGGGDPARDTQHLLPRGLTIRIDAILDSDVVTDHGVARRRIIQAHLVDKEPQQ